MSYNRLNFILWFVLTKIIFAFLTSILSATALIGLFKGFKFFIVIFNLSLTILPFHLLGLNALMGDMDNFFEFKLKIGP